MARPFAYPQGAEPVSLATLLENARPKPPETKLERIFKALSPEDSAILVAAMKDPATPNTVIAKALTDAGHPIGAEAIRKARA